MSSARDRASYCAKVMPRSNDVGASLGLQMNQTTLSHAKPIPPRLACLPSRDSLRASLASRSRPARIGFPRSRPRPQPNQAGRCGAMGCSFVSPIRDKLGRFQWRDSISLCITVLVGTDDKGAVNEPCVPKPAIQRTAEHVASYSVSCTPLGYLKAGGIVGQRLSGTAWVLAAMRGKGQGTVTICSIAL